MLSAMNELAPVTMTIQLLGGLALFLYGVGVDGRFLENRRIGDSSLPIFGFSIMAPFKNVAMHIEQAK